MPYGQTGTLLDSEGLLGVASAKKERGASLPSSGYLQELKQRGWGGGDLNRRNRLGAGGAGRVGDQNGAVPRYYNWGIR